MKYFIDTEFIEKPGSIQLISIGMINEDGEEYYAISKDFNLRKVWKDKWLREKVLRPIHKELCEKLAVSIKGHNWLLYEHFSRWSMRNLLRWFGKPNKQIAGEIHDFVYHFDFSTGAYTDTAIESNIKDALPVEFYGYYADYDWVVFCWLFGRMIDLPKGFPKYCIDLKQMLDENGLDKNWKNKNCPNPVNEHNALADANWNFELYKAINEIKNP